MDYEKRGWAMRRWHTAFEPLTDDELMRELRSGDDVRFRAACDELERRPFTDRHWAMYAAAALDPKLSKHQRGYLPYLLYHGDDIRYEAQMRATFARTEDGDPRIRLFAAWVLCGLAQVEPGREFDLLATWACGPGAADAEVIAVREWWVNNAKREYWQGAASPTTILQSR